MPNIFHRIGSIFPGRGLLSHTDGDRNRTPPNLMERMGDWFTEQKQNYNIIKTRAEVGRVSTEIVRRDTAFRQNVADPNMSEGDKRLRTLEFMESVYDQNTPNSAGQRYQDAMAEYKSAVSSVDNDRLEVAQGNRAEMESLTVKGKGIGGFFGRLFSGMIRQASRNAREADIVAAVGFGGIEIHEGGHHWAHSDAQELAQRRQLRDSGQPQPAQIQLQADAQPQAQAQAQVQGQEQTLAQEVSSLSAATAEDASSLSAATAEDVSSLSAATAEDASSLSSAISDDISALSAAAKGTQAHSGGSEPLSFDQLARENLQQTPVAETGSHSMSKEAPEMTDPGL